MVEGKIQKVYKNLTKEGTSYLIIEVDNMKYGVWDKKLFGLCTEGQNITFTYQQKGDYKNILNIEGSETVNNQPKNLIKPREITMQKMNALNNSVNLLKIMAENDLLQKEEISVERVFMLADRFMAYITQED